MLKLGPLFVVVFLLCARFASAQIQPPAPQPPAPTTTPSLLVPFAPRAPPAPPAPPAPRAPAAPKPPVSETTISDSREGANDQKDWHFIGHVEMDQGGDSKVYADDVWAYTVGKHLLFAMDLTPNPRVRSVAVFTNTSQPAAFNALNSGPCV